MQNLIDLVKQQSDLVERENWKYYYQADNYKFNNVYLANWYEQKNNSWAAFVAQPVNKIKRKLSAETFDSSKNYDLEYLNKLRHENSYLQFFFSGGTDSYTLLKLAIDNDIFIDELVCVATGNHLRLKENQEIYQNALPIAKKYKNKYGKLTIKQITLEDHHRVYRDPCSLVKYPECGASYPIYRRMFNNFESIDGARIIGPEKPQLLYYNKKWYTVMLDSSLTGLYAIDKDLILFNYEPENIFSLIKDSILYRNHLLEEIDLNNNLQFFKLNDQQIEIINREKILKKQYNKFHSNGPSIWNYKDEYALCETVRQQNLSLLRDYYKSVDFLLSLYPDYDFSSRNFSPMKFGWFIDIDSLAVYTQQELIPNGFEY